MRNFLGFVLILALIVGIVGWYRGWFAFSTTTSAGDDKTNVDLNIDRAKIRQDTGAVRDRAREIGGSVIKQSPAEKKEEPSSTPKKEPPAIDEDGSESSEVEAYATDLAWDEAFVAEDATVRGTVVEVIPEVRELRIHAGSAGLFTVEVKEDVRIEMGEGTARLESLKPGNFVRIAYRVENDKNVARTVTLRRDLATPRAQR